MSYCAACSCHGTDQHDFGCKREPDAVKRLEYRIAQVEDELDRLRAFMEKNNLTT